MSSQPENLQARIVEGVKRVLGERAGMVLLHGPEFAGHEWAYVKECIDTAWVSSAGAYVGRFEQSLADYTGAKYAVATVNGTAALFVALQLVGVQPGDEVLIPALTFIATANAVTYCHARPHLCDVEETTLGLDAGKLGAYLREIAKIEGGQCINKRTGARIRAIVPMHTFGHAVDLEGLLAVAQEWGLVVVEDAAESLGSFYHGQHTGTFGRLGILSFNGNKIVTTGGGGAILTNDADLARHAKHITTTAKVPHAWEFYHDETGYNYRMPNINAALGVAQLEQLPGFVERKRRLARRYLDEFAGVGGVRVMTEPAGCASNYWLNTLVLDKSDKGLRDQILGALNEAKIQSRPIWQPMHKLPMYDKCPRMDLSTTDNLSGRIINVPSSAGLMAR
ncbi:MAG: LegC family aminotransferase [Phycisphaerales bacterium]|nr:LegC family aminotransferase [Phycisphaerales bacterium]